jgi:hypothetical protein
MFSSLFSTVKASFRSNEKMMKNNGNSRRNFPQNVTPKIHQEKLNNFPLSLQKKTVRTLTKR